MKRNEIKELAKYAAIPYQELCRRLTSCVPLDGAVYDLEEGEWTFDMDKAKSALAKETERSRYSESGRYLSGSSLAKVLGVNRRTTVLWTRQGLPYKAKTSNSYTIDVFDVAQWLDKQGIKYEGYARLLREYLKKLDV